MIMSIKRWLLSRFKKPSVAVLAEEKWFYARILGRDDESAGESLWRWQKVLPATEGGWIATDRVGIARCANGTPIDDPPYVTIVRRDSDGWAFCARVGV
jgi:hypothetical protein